MARLKDTTAPNFTSQNPATDPGHVPRWDQVQTAIAGAGGAPAAHTHPTGDITGLSTYVDGRIGGYFDESYSVYFSGTTINVRLKSGGGIQIDGNGLSVDATLFSPVSHTHAQLHDAATKLDTDSIAISITGQQISADLQLATGSGLVIDGGLKCVFGTSAGQVAEGNHTHAELHDALTVDNSATIALTLVDQLLEADVTLRTGSGMVTSGGLGVDFGTGNNQAARGDHSHANATESVAGFMAPADKTAIAKLRHEHAQNMAASTWNITHNLGRKATVQIYNGAGVQIWGRITRNSNNAMTVEFNSQQSGHALCA